MLDRTHENNAAAGATGATRPELEHSRYSGRYKSLSAHRGIENGALYRRRHGVRRSVVFHSIWCGRTQEAGTACSLDPQILRVLINRRRWATGSVASVARNLHIHDRIRAKMQQRAGRMRGTGRGRGGASQTDGLRASSFVRPNRGLRSAQAHEGITGRSDEGKVAGGAGGG